jgi:hypothetical protein
MFTSAAIGGSDSTGNSAIDKFLANKLFDVLNYFFEAISWAFVYFGAGKSQYSKVLRDEPTIPFAIPLCLLLCPFVKIMPVTLNGDPMNSAWLYYGKQKIKAVFPDLKLRANSDDRSLFIRNRCA